MSDYTKSTDFTSKDSLPSGNANKVIKGSEFDTEFDAIESAISTKADSSQESVIAPTLLNSWVNYGGTSRNVGYYKDTMGRVHLMGAVKDGTTGVNIFQLPEGYRSSASLAFSVQTGSNTLGRVNVNPSGGGVALAAGTTSFVSLDGISFLAEG